MLNVEYASTTEIWRMLRYFFVLTAQMQSGGWFGFATANGRQQSCRLAYHSAP